jgi:hypothetical protein
MARKKSPVLAALLSFIIPGIGQVYVGERGKGMGFFLIGTIFVFLEIFLIRNNDRGMELGPVLVAGISIILFWIYNTYDAYITAKNKRE